VLEIKKDELRPAGESASRPGENNDQAIQIWGLASAAGIAIGSVGTWASLGPFSLGGTSGSGGKIALALGVITLIIVALHYWSPSWNREITGFVTGIAGLITAGVGIHGTIKILGAGTTIFGVSITPSIGWGLVVVDLAALSLIVWSWISYKQTHPQNG